jgi:ubiquinol-cytochrome c reductase cytochrome c subunit
VSDNADLDEFGFAPAVSATGADPVSAISGQAGAGGAGAGANRRAVASGTPPRTASRRNFRRRLAGAGVLAIALAGMGGLYGLFASSSNGADTAGYQQQVQQGSQLYSVSCITCHGANLQGVADRGPSLIGVGQSATYFQVSTGRMPATGEGAEENRKTSNFTEAQTEALSAYVQSIGGGPQIPAGSLQIDAANNPTQLAEGGQLFRLNCASCHGSTAKGAPLSAGKTAPSLNKATDAQLYAAMQSGPESMPVFSDNQLTPLQKKEIITYVQTLKASQDPGGNGIDRIGPVSEGLVIWVLGIGALVATILWIGAKS